jgi:hypothetical protein
VPVVVLLAEALDPVVGQPGDALLPQSSSFVVILVDGDPEVLLVEAVAAVSSLEVSSSQA